MNDKKFNVPWLYTIFAILMVLTGLLIKATLFNWKMSNIFFNQREIFFQVSSFHSSHIKLLKKDVIL